MIGGAGLLGQAATGCERRAGDAERRDGQPPHRPARRVSARPWAGRRRLAHLQQPRRPEQRRNRDNWRQSTDRRVYGLVGGANNFGSTVKRVAADGSVATYRYDGAGYVETDGAGSYDRLSYAMGSGPGPTATPGRPKPTATAPAAMPMSPNSDTSGNALTYSYSGDRLTQVATANGERISYVWNGSAIAEIQTHTIDGGTARMQTRTRSNMMRPAAFPPSRWTSAEDNSVADGKSYVTSYGYHGTSRLVAWISQSDGTRVDVAYDGIADRVASVTQTVDGSCAKRARASATGRISRPSPIRPGR
ncbi:hypothetical protein AB5I41_23555 [Sphingomonas sp. MMS24-JH45]